MKLKRNWVSGLLAAALALTGIAVAAPTAHAITSKETIKLCGGEPGGPQCTIVIDDKFLEPDPHEGTTLSFTVTGTPDVAVSFSVHFSEVFGDTFKFGIASDPITLTPRKAKPADKVGTVRGTLKTRPLPSPFTSHVNLTVQPTDWRIGFAHVGNKPERFVGMSETQVVSKRPRDRGFEAAPTKDGVFNRLLFNASASARYSVQVKVSGVWVSADAKGPVKGAGVGITKLPGQLPPGMPSGKYDTRVINVTDGHTDLTVGHERYLMDLDWKMTTSSKLFNVYTTPGTWDVNGRKWKTSCEAYSATERCRTEIWATQILYKAGSFDRADGWAFNNLTYKPSPRSLWKGNPLGGNGTAKYAGQWTAEDGRKWRVECDTAASGRNGCRSYAMAKVAEPVSPGAATYRVVDKWLFNNIVQFAG